MPSTHSLVLPVEMPFDWKAVLAFLRLRASPGVESVSDSAYMRTCGAGGAVQRVCVTHDPAGAALRISYTGDGDSMDEASRKDGGIEDCVRRIFRPEVDTGAIEEFLGRDRRLHPYVSRQAGLRVPGGWSGFEVAARAILGQQVSVAAATTLMGRLVRAAGARVSESEWLFPLPEQVLAADLSSLGIPGSRRETLKAISVFMADRGEERLGRPDAMEHLLALRGIGRWTAGYILMRTSQSHDHWPEGDLVLRKALGSGKELISPQRLIEAFRRWSPYRGYATLHLWRGYAAGAFGRT
jgi:AraC family transcriptional regulator of adaptative response / DNA-3-methyladenine glycosylase II